MEKVLELHQIIYGLFAAQIEFGTYGYKDPLPKMEDVSHWFSVSLDTVKTAYHQLKVEGYITLTKKAGPPWPYSFRGQSWKEISRLFFLCVRMQ